MDEMILNMALAIIFGVVKNPAKKEHMKRALLKLRNAINNLYPGE